MIFQGLEKSFGGLRPRKRRPNDCCSLWKNHFEGLRPQTTYGGQIMFVGLGKSFGRPEGSNHKRGQMVFAGLVVVVVVVVAEV